MAAATCLLQDIFSGVEESRQVLFEDSTDHNGRPLLRQVLNHLVMRCNAVHVLLTDLPKQLWSQGISDDVLKRVSFTQWLTDPLGWNGNSVPVEDSIVADIFPALPCSDESNTVLIVDNLSTVLLHYQYTNVCRAIQKLGQQYAMTYFLVHQDLHEDHVMQALNYMMSSTVRMLPEKSSCLCFIRHRRKSGKILKEVNSYSFLKESIIYSRIGGKTKETKHIEEVPIDPAANLTFDLHLTDRQKQDRSRVVLPYTQTTDKKQYQHVGTGQVTYQLDEVDDWDESDPDDDLDI